MRRKQRCSISHTIAYIGLEFSFPARRDKGNAVPGVRSKVFWWTMVRVKVKYADEG